MASSTATKNLFRIHKFVSGPVKVANPRRAYDPGPQGFSLAIMVVRSPARPLGSPISLIKVNHQSCLFPVLSFIGVSLFLIVLKPLCVFCPGAVTILRVGGYASSASFGILVCILMCRSPVRFGKRGVMDKRGAANERQADMASASNSRAKLIWELRVIERRVRELAVATRSVCEGANCGSKCLDKPRYELI